MKLYNDLGAILKIELKDRSGLLLTARIENLPITTETQVPWEVKIFLFRAAYDLHERLRRSHTFINAEKPTNPKFPSEPTTNQSFDERKMMAYRALSPANGSAEEGRNSKSYQNHST